MLSQRSYGWDLCALLAVIFGLGTAATCWADDPWPDSVGPHSGTGLCQAATDYCFQKDCLTYSSGQDTYWFTCGTTLWNSTQRIQQRLPGQCTGGTSPPCTYYDAFFCAELQVYELPLCRGAKECKVWVHVAGAICDPNNSGG
jgi:hypothetical protein